MVVSNMLFNTVRRSSLAALLLFVFTFVLISSVYGHTSDPFNDGQRQIENSDESNLFSDAADHLVLMKHQTEHQPRFLYSVTDNTTLRDLAHRLDISYDCLRLYNDEEVHADSAGSMASSEGSGESNSQHERVYMKGDHVVVPLFFPLHDDMEPLKVDVLENRFVASYRIPLSYSRVDEIIDWYRTRLVEFGYVFHETDERAGTVRLFSGGMIALGTVEFSPGDEQNPTLIDMALVVDRDRPYQSGK